MESAEDQFLKGLLLGGVGVPPKSESALVEKETAELPMVPPLDQGYLAPASGGSKPKKKKKGKSPVAAPQPCPTAPLLDAAEPTAFESSEEVVSVESPKDRWAWSSFQNSPDPDALPISPMLASMLAGGLASSGPPPSCEPPPVGVQKPIPKPAETPEDRRCREAGEEAERANVAQVAQAEAQAEAAKRDAVAMKLRNAAMSGDPDALTEAISEAEDAGLSHEAAIGRKKLSSLGFA